MGTNIIMSIRYIILGLIAMVLGKFLPDRSLMPNKTKYKVTDKKRYLKSTRFILYGLGIYYIVLGMILILIKRESIFLIYFEVILPFLVYVPLLFVLKKHLQQLKKLDR